MVETPIWNDVCLDSESVAVVLSVFFTARSPVSVEVALHGRQHCMDGQTKRLGKEAMRSLQRFAVPLCHYGDGCRHGLDDSMEDMAEDWCPLRRE